MSWIDRIGSSLTVATIVLPVSAMAYALLNKPGAQDYELVDQLRGQVLPAVSPKDAKLYSEPVRKGQARLSIQGVQSAAEWERIVQQARRSCGRIAGLKGVEIEFFAQEPQAGEPALARVAFDC